MKDNSIITDIVVAGKKRNADGEFALTRRAM